MFFAVDVGNSHTVTGMYDNDRLITKWRLKSNSKSTADELAISYHALFEMANISENQIEGVVIASVVPTLETAWLRYCENHFPNQRHESPVIASTERLKELITVQLDNPKEVGADRLINAIAAWSDNKTKQIIIDFGTAITFDCVTDKCEYIGGTILPGIAISLEALSSKTAKLPHIDVTEKPENIIGKSTVQAMKSGILHGYGAMVDGLVKGIKSEMLQSPDEEFRVVATGGMAQLIAPYSSSIDVIDPMLTLKGLKIIYDKVVKR